MASCLNYNLIPRIQDDNTINSNQLDEEGFLRNSVDLYIYLKSIIKDIDNKRLMKGFKQIAYDGVLNYKRNFDRSSDKDFSKALDYGSKKPQMWSKLNIDQVQESDLVKNTKILIYNKKNLDLIDGFVVDKLKREGIVTLEEIVSFVSDRFEDIYIYIYFDQRVSNIKLTDKFGDPYKVNKNNGCIYVEDKDYTFMKDQVNRLPLVEEDVGISREQEDKRMNDILDDLRGKTYDEMVKIVRSKVWVLNDKGVLDKTQTDEYVPVIQKLIEHSILKKVKNQESDETKAILKMFYQYVGVAEYPTELVKQVEEEFKKVSKNVGKKASSTSETKLRNLKKGTKFSKNRPSGKPVYYHWYHKISFSRVANIYTTDEFEARILVSGEDKFRTVNDNEKYIFKDYISTDKENVLEPFSKLFFGSVMRDGKFRLHKPDSEKRYGCSM